MSATDLRFRLTRRSFYAVLAAIITLTVSVGVTDRPERAPQTGPWDKEIIVVGNPSFLQAISAVSVLVFCYAGTPAL